MVKTVIRLYSILVIVLLNTPVFAQESSYTADSILFVWNNQLSAQSMLGKELVQTAIPTVEDQPPTNTRSVYTFEDSPLLDPPADGYGFHQGVWSADRTRFVFLAIEPDGPGYRIIEANNEQQNTLLAASIDQTRGYLVPVGWTAEDESLILLERYMLHNLREVKLWQYNPVDDTLTLHLTISIPDLKGNSVSLDDEWAFIGFDTIGVQGYLLNFRTGQLAFFPTSFALQDPPPSVFEQYPINVLGSTNLAAFKTWVTQQPSQEPIPAENTRLTTPFLHWPLPDYARGITCYPDSEWTDLHYAVECPKLAAPRAYAGHEGTDVGGKPDGLAVGTAVYAAARGIVIKTFTNCSSDDITCGDAYGNHILIEHTRVNNGNTETWFTGYAHLQTVLVEPYTYIEEIGLPIATSGDTGLGGAHLHFEVRSPEYALTTNWIDPWDERLTAADGAGLWIGDSERPIAAVEASPPPTLLNCQTIAGNNIRSGPGISYEVIATSTAETNYEVFQSQHVTNDQAPGEWYHIRWQTSDVTGWLWAGLMETCAATTTE